MRILLRVESGGRIGYGHLFRSLSLAEELKKRKNKIVFLTQTSEEFIKKKNFSFKKIFKNTPFEILSSIKEINPDVIIFDLPYDYPKKYQKEISENFPDCFKVVLDEKFSFEYADIFINSLVKTEKNLKNLFQGEKYLILSKEVRKYHLKDKIIRKKPSKVLITFGGSDPYHLTEKILSYLKGFEEVNFTVILGPGFKRKIKCRSENIYFKKNVNSLPALIYDSDIGITSYGITLYEFCCIGTPALTISYNEYTDFFAKKFSKKGTCMYLGIKDNLEKEYFLEKLKNIIVDYKKREKMSINGKKIIDGKGAERIAEIIQKCRKKF